MAKITSLFGLSFLIPFVFSPLALGADICTLVSKGEAASLLGQPVTHMTPSKPEKDEDTGGMLTYCSYRAGTLALVVSVLEFSSPAEARKNTTKEVAAGRLDEDAKVIDESGLGDRAYWVFSTQTAAAGYIVQKGTRVLGIMRGGQGLGAPEKHKEALRKAAAGALGRL
jgi:hypothetical protein